MSLLVVLYLDLTTGYGTKSNQIKEESSAENYEELYTRGRRAYLDNSFKDCVTLIEAGLTEYKSYNSIVNQCKLGCKQNQDLKPSVVLHVREYVHYEALIRETLCLMKCKRGKINPNRREEIKDPVLVQDFITRRTYDYLQLCYFQTQKHQEAANAAFTNTVYNPKHEIMKENLQYYLLLPGVHKDKLVNLETAAFVQVYREARTLYTAGVWGHCVQKMEEALKLYLQEENICRVGCEKPFNMGWYPDFVSSVANHFTFCLKCKLNCATDLHTIDGMMEEDLLPLFYHYLQFAYFKLSDLKQAAGCARTYLIFRPGSVDMQNNLNYYSEYSDFKGVIRTEAKLYLDREVDELNLLEFIENSFVFTEDQNIDEESLQKPEDVEKKKLDKENGENNHDYEQIGQSSGQGDEVKYNKGGVNEEAVGEASENDSDQENESDGPTLFSPPPIVRFEL